MSDSSAAAPRNLLPVNESLSIPRTELDVRVSRSSGAGGQFTRPSSRIAMRVITRVARSLNAASGTNPRSAWTLLANP